MCFFLVDIKSFFITLGTKFAPFYMEAKLKMQGMELIVGQVDPTKIIKIISK